MTADAELYRVQTSYFCAGVLVLQGRVLEAPPILRWAEGQTLEALTRWVKGKGGSIEIVVDERKRLR